MDTVLTIDISSTKARALVVEVNENDLKLVEEHESTLDAASALNEILDELIKAKARDTEVSDEDEENSEDPESEQSQETTPGAKLAEVLKDLIQNVESPWVSSVLIIPSCDYLSLNVPLPFGDEKSIYRVIDLEVQDLIPFSVDEFHVNHCVVSEEANGEHDVHVGMMPRDYIRSILKSCSQAQYEPNIVSTHTSALAAMYYLAPDYMEKNSAVVYIEQGKCYICLAIDGRVKTDRIIFGSTLSGGSDANAGSAQLIRDLKLSINGVEKRYGVTIAKVYILGSEMSASNLQQSLGRSVEEIHADEFIKSQEQKIKGEQHLVGLSAVFARDIEPPAVLSNFRTREFSYSPQIQQLKKFGRQIAPYLGLLAVLILLYYASIYGIRSYQISSLESAVSAEVRKVAPQLSATFGDELSALSAENANLEEELALLGSKGKFSPLDSFLEVSKDLNRVKKRAPDIEVSKMRIGPGLIELEGQSPDFTSVNLIKRVFEDNKKVYCKINPKSSKIGGTYKFEFDLTLCDL